MSQEYHGHSARAAQRGRRVGRREPLYFDASLCREQILLEALRDQLAQPSSGTLEAEPDQTHAAVRNQVELGRDKDAMRGASAGENGQAEGCGA